MAAVTDGADRPQLDAAVRRQPLVRTIERCLGDRCGVPRGGRLLIGCSGGADSVALVLACTVLADRRRSGGAACAPRVVHVHHHLRAAADDDAAFVVDLCASLGLPCAVEHVHPRDASRGLPAAARRLRYAALARQAVAHGCEAVATGHHAEDQLETILMALARGGGLDGLSGMAWSAPVPGDEPAGDAPVRLVRPMLEIRRAACAAMCRAAGIVPREDPGNADPGQVRGRLRRDVLPVLDALWPGAAERANATAELARAAASEVDARLARAFGPPSARRWDRAALRVLPRALVAAGLRRAALHAAPPIRDDLGWKLLAPAADAILDRQRRPRRYRWPANLELRVDADDVTLAAV